MTTSDVQAELTTLREALAELSGRLEFPNADLAMSHPQRLGAKECIQAAWRYVGEALNYLSDY